MGVGACLGSAIGAGLGILGFARRVVVFLAAGVLAWVAAARRAAGEDPGAATARPTGEVEGYLQ